MNVANFKLPPGLPLLYAFCLIERTAFLTFKYSLILTLVHLQAYSDSQAALTAGAFTAVMFFLYAAAGIAADRVLGFRYTFFAGIFTVLIAHGCILFWTTTPVVGLGANIDWSTAIILAAFAVGTAMYRICCLNIVGAAYQPGDPNRESGFAIYYWTESTGALIAVFFAGTAIPTGGWILGYGPLIVGMLVFGTVLALYRNRLTFPDEKSDGQVVSRVDGSAAHSRTSIYRPPGIQLLLPIFLVSTAALVIGVPQLAILPTVALAAGVFGYIVINWRSISRVVPRKNVIELSLVTVVVIIYSAAQEQQWGLLMLFAERYVELNFMGMPLHPTHLQFIVPACLVLLAPAVAWSVARLNTGPRFQAMVWQSSVAFVLVGLSFFLLFAGSLQVAQLDRVPLMWVVAALLALAISELLIMPAAFDRVTSVPNSMRGAVSGSWFLSFSVGGYLSGVVALIAVGGQADGEPTGIDGFSRFFGLSSLFFVLLVGVLLAYSVWRRNGRLRATDAGAKMSRSGEMRREEHT